MHLRLISLLVTAVAMCACGENQPPSPPSDDDTSVESVPLSKTVDASPEAGEPTSDAGAPDGGMGDAAKPLLDQLLARLPSLGFDAIEDTRSPGDWMGTRRRALGQAGVRVGKGLANIRVIRFRARSAEIRDGQKWYPEGWIEQWSFAGEPQARSVAVRLKEIRGLDENGMSHFFGRFPYAMYRQGSDIVSIQMRARSWSRHVGNVAVMTGFLAEGSQPPLEEVLYMAGPKPRGLGGPGTQADTKPEPVPVASPAKAPVPLDETSALKLVGGVPWPADEMMSIRLSPGEAGKAMVLVGAPTVNGPISDEQVGAVVLPGLDSLDACYEKHIARRPGLSGTLLIDLTVTGNGRVDSSTPSGSTIGDPQLENCLAEASKKWRFPSFDGTATIAVPLGLDSGE